MSDSEKESVHSDLDVRYIEFLFNCDVDAGEGVYWYGIDQTCEYIDGDDNEAVSLLLIFCCLSRHYEDILFYKSDYDVLLFQ